MAQSLRPRSTSALAVVGTLVAAGCFAAAYHPSGAAASVTDGMHGRILSGSAAVSGAHIAAVAWPNGKTLAALPNGAKVLLRTVGTAVADSTGAYHLVMNLASLKPKYREPDGTVNVEVDLTTAASSARWNVPITPQQIAPHPARVALPAFVFNLANATVSGAGVAPGANTMSVAPAGTMLPSDYGPSPSPSPGPDEDPCSDVAGRRVPDRPEHFLNVWAWSGVPTTVTESLGSKHTVGLGITYDGVYWSGYGTADVESGQNENATATFRSNRSTGNSINYRRFTLVCQGTTQYRTARPTGLDALLPAKFTKHKIAAPKFKHCVRYRRGQTLTVDHSSNTTYAAGVGLGFVNLSAHASMTKQTIEAFNIKKGTFICGNNRSSLTKSARLAAKRP